MVISPKFNLEMDVVGVTGPNHISRTTEADIVGRCPQGGDPDSDPDLDAWCFLGNVRASCLFSE